MKKEETTYSEKTRLDPASGQEPAARMQEAKAGKGGAWRGTGAGMGMGLLLGTTSSFVTSEAMHGDPHEPAAAGAAPAAGSRPAWSDGTVVAATGVDDSMSFSEAFATARAEAGPGGAFEWRGGVYGTYTAEEWRGMSAEEKADYNGHFHWGSHAAAAAEPEAQVVPEPQPVPNPEAAAAGPAEDAGQGEEAAGPDIEIIGVVHDEESGANFGRVTVDGREVVFVDADGDHEYFELMAADLDNDGQISEGEIMDISSQHLPVSRFEQEATDNYLADNDDMPDYANDAPDACLL